ncbi:ubiquitin carboxyl-terminal hydrolase MINDY-3-like [Salvia splendens]|uniref:ubiquitin carboxyl-terminal hydrolase MINDY-3-like n=1 Tax=Salvia splendens TaxID=180675 RepID=UPI001C27834E|nr:ubiquitin carboxyl-terminal hydrolase MINDY-3-like [Salvia splendens]
MVDQEDVEMKMALRHDSQPHESPEPKRSKPRDSSGGEDSQRRMQRELRAAAAEKRMEAARGTASAAGSSVVGSGKGGEVEQQRVAEGQSVAAAAATATEVENVESVGDVNVQELEGASIRGKGVFGVEGMQSTSGISDISLSVLEADELFFMIFGNGVSKDVLSQWTNQGIRFSDDPETSMGLVQHEGGPCGVLAAIQAFVLKYLLFSPEDNVNAAHHMSNLSMRRLPINEFVAADIFSSLSEEKKSRALVRSMCEILFLCGRGERAVIVSLNSDGSDSIKSANRSEDEVIAEVFGGLSVESGADLQKVLRVHTCTSFPTAIKRLEAMLPVFRSRMGALLFLISALLSRGLDNVQEDRDDPTLPLVTAPFGHASQEIVNLLLSGSAVPNVFDGKIDLGSGMFVKGLTTPVEVGFLTLLESLNYCKVGQYLKCPRWPIWVVGSESHYTVLFALDTKVQDENEFEYRESQIRRAFDAQDQSGGGGFIGVEGFHHVIRETNINLPADKIEHLCSTGFIVWSEFWQALLDLDKSLGGMKDSTGHMGRKVFDLYHFNGIAKSVVNGSQALGNESPVQRPRITKLRVSVPPRWTPEEFMAGPDTRDSGNSGEVSKPAPGQHAPLVDCIRTRWPRSVCNWEGDAPSIV